MTVPRLELCGAVRGCRLRETIQKEIKYQYKKVFHVVDSSIVRAQIQKESYGFGSFVATKIAGTQNKSDPNEWWWIATGDNPADMVTRSASPSQIGPDSIWQRGPKFFDLPIDKWPISQESHLQEHELPDRIRIHISQAEKGDTNGDVSVSINLENFNNYIKLLRVRGGSRKSSSEGLFQIGGPTCAGSLPTSIFLSPDFAHFIFRGPLHFFFS